MLIAFIILASIFAAVPEQLLFWCWQRIFNPEVVSSPLKFLLMWLVAAVVACVWAIRKRDDFRSSAERIAQYAFWFLLLQVLASLGAGFYRTSSFSLTVVTSTLNPMLIGVCYVIVTQSLMLFIGSKLEWRFLRQIMATSTSEKRYLLIREARELAFDGAHTLSVCNRLDAAEYLIEPAHLDDTEILARAVRGKSVDPSRKNLLIAEVTRQNGLPIFAVNNLEPYEVSFKVVSATPVIPAAPAAAPVAAPAPAEPAPPTAAVTSAP